MPQNDETHTIQPKPFSAKDVLTDDNVHRTIDTLMGRSAIPTICCTAIVAMAAAPCLLRWFTPETANGTVFPWIEAVVVVSILLIAVIGVLAILKNYGTTKEQESDHPPESRLE